MPEKRQPALRGKRRMQMEHRPSLRLPRPRRALVFCALLGLSVAALLSPNQLRAQTPTPPAIPAPPVESAADAEQALGQFLQVLQVVREHAATPVDLKRSLYEGAIPAMLRQLDPHSAFLDPDQFAQLRRMQRSEAKGFGSVVSILPGKVLVLQTLPGTPSAKAGLSAGDEILAVNNIAFAGLSPDQLVELLSQARQHEVQVWIRKPGNARPLAFRMVPAEMAASSVERAFLLEPGYAYLKVASFDENTAKDMKSALERLGGEQLRGLVLDLRNNPGGAVSSALDAAALFLSPGQKILSAKGRRMNGEEMVPASAKPYRFPVAILLNEKTGSAAEILSGALQDHERATLVGDSPSFGKGLVQNVFPLSDGAGLALTLAFYYTPSGRNLQKPVSGMQLSKAMQEESQKEYQTVKGRSVKGGGGVQPDTGSIPRSLPRLAAALEAGGAYTAFVAGFLPTAKYAVKPGFEPPLAILDHFRLWLSQNRVQPTLRDWSESTDAMLFRLRQEILTQAISVEEGDKVEAEREGFIQAGLAAVKANR